MAYEVNWTCFKQSGEPADGSGEGMNHCKMIDAFGDADGNPISDPREPRPVATARYELYWMWSLQYNKESWLMLIDARDVWFQLNPFEELSSREKVYGELHLFGVRMIINILVMMITLLFISYLFASPARKMPMQSKSVHRVSTKVGLLLHTVKEPYSHTLNNR